MNTWPWQELEDNKKREDYIGKRLMEEKEKIFNHFNGDAMLFSEWIADNFTPPVLMEGGADILIKYSFCEKCESYVGPNPIKRKIYNIHVINGYCTKHADTTTPEFRCTAIEFDPFWKQIMRLQISRLELNKYPFPKLLDIPKLNFEDGSLDAY
jgi:hypothetical protein